MLEVCTAQHIPKVHKTPNGVRLYVSNKPQNQDACASNSTQQAGHLCNVAYHQAGPMERSLQFYSYFINETSYAGHIKSSQQSSTGHVNNTPVHVLQSHTGLHTTIQSEWGNTDNNEMLQNIQEICFDESETLDDDTSEDESSIDFSLFEDESFHNATSFNQYLKR